MSKPESRSESGGEPNPRPKSQPKRQSGGDRRGAIAGLIIAVVILGVGWWLARDLTAASKMQDCLMSGRSNCNVIEPAR
ncbi:type IV secretory pathway TrbD component [Bradyrhizobium sp. USDA 4354]